MRHVQHWKRPRGPRDGKLLADGIDRCVYDAETVAIGAQRRFVLGKRECMQFQFAALAEFSHQVERVGANAGVKPPGIDAERTHGDCIALARTS